MNSNDLAGTQATINLGDVLGAVASRVERQFEALLRDLPAQGPGNRYSQPLHTLNPKLSIVLILGLHICGAAC